MSEDIVLKVRHGLVTVLSMNYRFYDLVGPTLTRPPLSPARVALGWRQRLDAVHSYSWRAAQ